ncbi:TonB-dependent receptor [soil metagenome]
MKKVLALIVSLTIIIAVQDDGRASVTARVLSGVIVTSRDELVPGATVRAETAAGEVTTTSDAEGRFRLVVPDGGGASLTLKVTGKNIDTVTRTISPGEATENLRIEINYLVDPIHESIVIVAESLAPGVERRDDAVYRSSLFARDDQILQTLAAGINAGQHEGGGKSLEIRRFGFNLDHGGVSGGLKILVDNFQQNQGTQGHGQGYLGQLKSLTPELVQDVDILNGPFHAQYGDFSGLGVVHIRLKESLPDQLTLRVQGGSFDTGRAFIAYSPALANADALLAYEGSRTDGPFLSPLRYRRDNVTGNYTYRLSEQRAVGLKFNFGRNDFFSSGQIPLDEVAAGRLDRFGFIDPDNGGRIKTGVLAAYYRNEGAAGDVFKLDGFIGRSLFDLFSNFTFFLNDPTGGDEIQQHDSRLQEGANAQYLRPYKIFGRPALLIAGANFHANQINVGLYRTIARDPFAVATDARARVTNVAGYAQQSLDVLDGHLHLEGGLRYDFFRFSVDDLVSPQFSGTRRAGRWQPKAGVAYTTSHDVPVTFHLNYGRGISSQDARGVVQQPDGPPISTTDFYQFGTSHNLKRFSLSTDLFLIDRSNEQVYIPDDGSFEFRGPSRSYGFELKNSVQLMPHLSFNGGLTRVMNAFFRGTSPRVYLDSAPHTVVNAAVTLSDYRGFTSSLRYRHISNYRLDGEDASIRAAGHDVLDFSLTKRLRRWLDFNLAIDNLTNKRYFETQNFFESRLLTDAPIDFDPIEDRFIYPSRIHGTPGYPFTATIGLTFRLFAKN